MFDGFWENVLRYQRYFVSTLLGLLLNTFAPVLALFKRPITLIPIIGILVGGFLFLTFTLRAMLGLNAV
ncbi:MAG: DUF751 family protein [Mastigocoleus sp.]